MLGKGPPPEGQGGSQPCLPRGSGCFLGQEEKWEFRLTRCIAALGGKMLLVGDKPEGRCI